MAKTTVLKPNPPLSTLRQRNSIAVPVIVPSKLTLFDSATAPPPLPLDFELLPLKPCASYTSLRDILPAAVAVNSPIAASGYEISIRNRLVKQAAWAYLQPMSSSPSSSAPHLLRRLCLPFSTCLCFLNHAFCRIFRVYFS